MSKRRVHSGKRVRVRVVLDSTGPLGGKLRIKDHGNTRRKIVLTSSNHLVVKASFPVHKVGRHGIRAYFSGNDYVAAAASRTVTARVTRP